MSFSVKNGGHIFALNTVIVPCYRVESSYCTMFSRRIQLLCHVLAFNTVIVPCSCVQYSYCTMFLRSIQLVYHLHALNAVIVSWYPAEYAYCVWLSCSRQLLCKGQVFEGTCATHVACPKIHGQKVATKYIS